MAIIILLLILYLLDIVRIGNGKATPTERTRLPCRMHAMTPVSLA
jgi:hypothetical protein